jgi:hypothetical protein
MNPPLPKNWDQMSVGELWDKLNDPDRFEGATKSTYDAVVWSLIWDDGWYDERVRRRLNDFSDPQLKQLIVALCRHKDRINPYIIAAIKDLL